MAKKPIEFTEKDKKEIQAMAEIGLSFDRIAEIKDVNRKTLMRHADTKEIINQGNFKRGMKHRYKLFEIFETKEDVTLGIYLDKMVNKSKTAHEEELVEIKKKELEIKRKEFEFKISEKGINTSENDVQAVVLTLGKEAKKSGAI